ncbi:MAG: response regulator [Gammaproteobacteria bacterium]|nr:MAG: response regulator [Gammaproteobacteria bacterium]
MNTPQRVLLIDHSETALAIIARLIQKNMGQVAVNVAHNANEAIALLQAHKYNLITMSRNLPDCDCHDLVSQIRNQLHVTTPLIVISGEEIDMLDEQLSCEYVNGYFDKKLGQHKLVAYIKSFISSATPEASIGGHILYVEDSATVAAVVKSFLQRHGYSYLLVKDAEHALKALQQSFTTPDARTFDMLITDIQLEGHMSGRDLIREIRHGIGLDHEQFPILVTTSSNYDADPQGLNRIFSAGANDILEKPVKESLLVARLNTLLTLRKLHSSLPSANASQAKNNNQQI